MGILVEYIRGEADKKGKDAASYLVEIAKLASKCALATNIGKFTHPDIKICAYIEPATQPISGYVYTSGENVEPDIYLTGGAVCMPVAKLLVQQLEDGKTVYQHLCHNTDFIRREFSELIGVDYENVRADLLQVHKGSELKESDQRLKQVYFPVNDNYHLLTVLPASSLMYLLKRKLKPLIDHGRDARDKKNAAYGQAYSNLPGLTSIKFGGTKPQNISLLNNRNGGTAYLLPSLPPQLEPRNIRRPRRDFFSEMPLYEFSENFHILHELYKIAHNNLAIRKSVRACEWYIIDQVLKRVYALRKLESGWTARTQLSVAEQLWLDNANVEARSCSEDSLDQIATRFVRWFVSAYEKTIGKEKIILGEAELAHLKTEIMDVLAADWEV